MLKNNYINLNYHFKEFNHFIMESLDYLYQVAKINFINKNFIKFGIIIMANKTYYYIYYFIKNHNYFKVFFDYQIRLNSID